MDDWNHLKFFVAVAKQGNVSRAAQFLRVSHATVLRHIDLCEKALNTRLFHKLQSGYRLTEQGQALLDRAAVIEAEMQAISEDFKHDDPLCGTLKVTQPENDVVNLYPLYKKFTQQYPNINLQLSSTSEVVNLNRREADVAIRFTNRPHELLVGSRLGKLTYGAYASQEYLAQFTHPVDLSALKWLVWQQANRSLMDSPQFQWLEKHVKEPQIVMRAFGVSDLISAIRAGMGVGFISLEIAKENPALVPIDGVTIKSHLQLWVLTHRDSRQVPKVAAFMNFLKTEFNNR